ncbi:hypothetical protein PtB15_11B166 [Puccinia triticina]|nr:hypothetical protein PtB15_11B166 [Puccinia triticina]
MASKPLQNDTQSQSGTSKPCDGSAVNIDIFHSDEKVKDASINSSADASTQVHRKLKQRHISMIAMAGAVVFSMQVALGEMVTMFPVTGAIPHYAERFFDPAMGFAGIKCYFNSSFFLAITISLNINSAGLIPDLKFDEVGVNVCLASPIPLAAEITAAAIVVEYWDATTPSWVYITIVGI